MHPVCYKLLQLDSRYDYKHIRKLYHLTLNRTLYILVAVAVLDVCDCFVLELEYAAQVLPVYLASACSSWEQLQLLVVGIQVLLSTFVDFVRRSEFWIKTSTSSSPIA